MEGVVRVGIYVIKWMIPHGVVGRVGFHVMTWMILYGATARIGIATCCQSCSCNKISIFSKEGSRILPRGTFHFEVCNDIIGKRNRCFKHHSYYLDDSTWKVLSG